MSRWMSQAACRALQLVACSALFVPALFLIAQATPGAQRTGITSESGQQSGMASAGPQKAEFDNQHRPITAGGTVKTGPVVFMNVAERAGLTTWRNVTGGPQKHIIVEAKGSGVALLDYDNDGWLDIYLVNGSTFDAQSGKATPPHAALFHNNHDGTFTDVAAKAGVRNDRWGLGVAVGDYDNDGWPDLYVANDTEPNYLYHNKHDGTFEDTALLAGAAVSAEGQPLGSMGVDFGDFNNDGNLDITVTTFAYQPIELHKGNGKDEFEDVTWPAKTGQPSFRWVKWGTGFVDLDNDGWQDIVVAAGHIYTDIDKLPGEPGYKEPLLLFRNTGKSTFDEMGDASGLNDDPPQSRRGIAFGDINNDGNIDAVVFNQNQPPTIFINDTKNSNHRVLFKLVGTVSNRAAIGARVTVQTASGQQLREVRSGSSYISQNDLRLHFGLGKDATISKVVIRWPNGKEEELKDVAADAIYTVVEGSGIKNKVALSD
jgi:enediyne biosynthesis protein E4